MQPQHAGGQGAEVPLQKASSERSHPLVLSAGRLQNRRLAFGIGGRGGYLRCKRRYLDAWRIERHGAACSQVGGRGRVPRCKLLLVCACSRRTCAASSAASSAAAASSSAARRARAILRGHARLGRAPTARALGSTEVEVRVRVEVRGMSETGLHVALWIILFPKAFAHMTPAHDPNWVNRSLLDYQGK